MEKINNKKPIISIVRFCLLIFLFFMSTSINWGQTNRRKTTGLIPASQEQLRGIPLASVPFSGDRLPSKVDLSVNLPPPGNQGAQNSCVGWTVSYALKSYQEKVEERISFTDYSGRLKLNRVFSPAFIYNQINNGRDGGSSFISALNLLSSKGTVSWADMPYNVNDYRKKPSSRLITRAKKYRIDFWRQVNIKDIKEVKAQLNAGYPVMVGVMTDDGFSKAGRGFVWKGRIGSKRGAHAILLVGYDNRYNAFKLINSYGKNWGDGGYGWVDYTHFTRVCSEGYVAKDAINQKKEIIQPYITIKPKRRKKDVISREIIPRRTYRNLSFSLSNIKHNTYYSDRPDLGYFMRFDGRVSIPSRRGKFNQITIYFYYDLGNGYKGRQVGSTNYSYADINGNAACGTAKYPISANGVDTTWSAWIPYAALNLPVGYYRQTYSGSVYQSRVTNLIAEPILFIDNFGVKTGKQILFKVTK